MRMLSATGALIDPVDMTFQPSSVTSTVDVSVPTG